MLLNIKCFLSCITIEQKKVSLCAGIWKRENVSTTEKISSTDQALSAVSTHSNDEK
ncbi:hypothetical protein M3580_14430 [Bacillus safensis]|uniref:hypothetical protein n=1 Tax=Bacillus safensis TaxID=561879 RepID=UPI00203B05CD|nr:hypothetical protein [Bacillus safensis]MCM2990413.1 hypothetical protein [Bacillus safensis]